MRLLIVALLLALCAFAAAQTPPPIDACLVYNGDNSTCQCSTLHPWVAFWVAVGTTPLFLFAIARYGVFVDMTLPGMGVVFGGNPSALVTTTNVNQQALSAALTLIATALGWVVLALRLALDLSGDDRVRCPQLNRFTWYAVLYTIVLMLAAVWSILNVVLRNAAATSRQ